MEITVHNDGKEKRNSYEVGLRMNAEDETPIVDDCSIINYDIEDLRGYGSSLEEAISNFKIGFMRLTEKISAISYIIQTADLRQIVTEVDCFRNPINSTNKEIKTDPPMPDFSIKSIEKTKNFDVLRFVADNAGLSTFEAIEKAYIMGVSEQEPILDKIRAEIQENINYNKKMNYQGIVAGLLLTLDIIDKYKAEN